MRKAEKLEEEQKWNEALKLYDQASKCISEIMEKTSSLNVNCNILIDFFKKEFVHTKF